MLYYIYYTTGICLSTTFFHNLSKNRKEFEGSEKKHGFFRKVMGVVLKEHKERP
jgi:oligoendopeptidase F